MAKKQTMFLGLSSSLTAGAMYSFIVSMDYHYFTPALGIFAGLVGGLGIAAKDLLSEKEKFDDIPLKDLAIYILFGITGLFLGYVFIYYFVKLPSFPPHGGYVQSADLGTIYNFLGNTMKWYDIAGATFGSICSASIPIIFKEKINNLIKRLKSNRLY